MFTRETMKTKGVISFCIRRRNMIEKKFHRKQRGKLSLIKNIIRNGPKYKIIVANNINPTLNAGHDSKCYTYVNTYFTHTNCQSRHYYFFPKDKEQCSGDIFRKAVGLGFEHK